MIRLLRVELTRLRWRRAVLLLILTALVLPALVVAVTLWSTRPVDAAELQRVEQQVAEEIRSEDVQRELQRCLDRPRRYGVPPDADVQATCEEYVLPQVEWYTNRFALDVRQVAEDGTSVAIAVILAMVLLLAGTTFVGHDWNTGSMSNQLLFQPRRLRVWTAKALALLVVGLVLSTVVLVGFWSAIWLTASLRDLPTADGTFRLVAWQALWAVLLATGAGIGGYALTMLFRSTVATLGVLFAAALVAPLLLTIVGFAGYERWLPQNNGAAVLLDGVEFIAYERQECFTDDGSVPPQCVTRVTRADGATYFGGLLAVAVVPSLLTFRRRDVPSS